MARGTLLQEAVKASESAIAEFDRAFLRMNYVTPLDETEESKAASDQAADTKE
jgi:hypothetical protein